MALSASSQNMSESFNSDDRLLILLTLAAPRPAEIDEAASLAASFPNWKRIQKRIEHNDIAPLIWSNLHRFGLWEKVPASLQASIAERRSVIERQNGLRLRRATELFRHFQKAGVQVIVLKGVAFAATIYRDPAYKKMNDIDLLIRVEDIAHARSALEAMDMVPLALLEGSEEDPDPRKTHHFPAYVSRDLEFVVGTHWGLASPKSGFRFDLDEIWNRKIPLMVAESPVFTLSPIDALHHLCVHFHYYKTGLKELGDFANLIRGNPDFDWPAFGRMVEMAGTQTAAFRPLRLTETIYEAGVPRALFESMKTLADAFVIRDTENLASRKDLLLMTRSTYSSQIEKAYLAFSYEDRFLLKFKWLCTFWKKMVFPPKAVVWRTNATSPGEESLHWLYLMNLYRTAREVGRDYGPAIFILLLVKSAVELFSGFLSGAGHERGKMAKLKEQLGQEEARINRFMEGFD